MPFTHCRSIAAPRCTPAARCLGALAVVSTVLFVSLAAVARESGAWRYSASVYLYLPSVDGKTSFPVDTGGTRFEASGDKDSR